MTSSRDRRLGDLFDRGSEMGEKRRLRLDRSMILFQDVGQSFAAVRLAKPTCGGKGLGVGKGVMFRPHTLHFAENDVGTHVADALERHNPFALCLRITPGVLAQFAKVAVKIRMQGAGRAFGKPAMCSAVVHPASFIAFAAFTARACEMRVQSRREAHSQRNSGDGVLRDGISRGLVTLCIGGGQGIALLLEHSG